MFSAPAAVSLLHKSGYSHWVRLCCPGFMVCLVTLLLRTAWTIWGYLNFYMNFRILFSNSVADVVRIRWGLPWIWPLSSVHPFYQHPFSLTVNTGVPSLFYGPQCLQSFEGFLVGTFYFLSFTPVFACLSGFWGYFKLYRFPYFFLCGFCIGTEESYWHLHVDFVSWLLGWIFIRYETFGTVIRLFWVQNHILLKKNNLASFFPIISYPFHFCDCPGSSTILKKRGSSRQTLLSCSLF